MTVHSLGPAKLKSILVDVRSFHVGSDLDDLDPNDYFALARYASELSLYGPEISEVLAGDWDRLDGAQRLLAVMLAQHAPSEAMTLRLVDCVEPSHSCCLRVEATAALGSAESDVAAPLLKSLSDDNDEGVRKAAIKALSGLADGGDVGALQRHIADSDAGVRREAVDALATIPGNRTASLLLAALDDQQMGVALAAKKHLLARKDERDLALDMIARLRDFGASGRYRLPYAVEILERLKDPRAIGPMLEHLDTCRNNVVKKALGKALAKMKDPAILPGIWRLAEDDHEKVQAEGLKLMLRHPDAGSVIVLRRIVDKIERKDDCPVIVSDPLVAAIAAIPGADSAKLLVDCAVSSQYRLIDAAVTALKKRGVDALADRLARRIADEDSDFFRDKLREVYARLVDAAELGTAAGTTAGDDEDSPAEESRYDRMQKLREDIAQMSDDEVIAYARSEDDFRLIEKTAFQRLVGIESAESSLQLRRFLKSPLIYERYCAARALEPRGVELSDADRLALLICSPQDRSGNLDEFRDVLGDVLEQTSDVNESYCTEEMISTLWGSGHPYRVAFAMRWLGININGKKYGKVAFDCLKSEPQTSEGPVLDALVNPPKFRKPDDRQLALLLGRFKCKGAVEPLTTRLSDQDAAESEQQHFAEALGLIGDPRAVPALVDMLPRVAEGPALRKILEALARLNARDAVSAIEAREIRNPKLEPVRQKVLAKLRK